MDGTVFDAWTRRRFGLAAGGLAAMVLALDSAWPAAAKNKRNKRNKCGKRKKRCHGKCIKKTQCCRDSDCPAGTYCCEGDCVSLETCCGNGTNGSCPDACPCRRNVEAAHVCISTVPVVCSQCHSNDECPDNWHCIPEQCGDVTATCRPLCLIGE